MGGGRWGWAAALAIAAGASGCDEGGAPVRGFYSRQLVSSRDPTLGLVSFGSKIVTVETDDGPSSYYDTDPDIAYYATGDSLPRTYWKLNLIDGTVTELGEQIPPIQPPGPPERFDCSYGGNGTGVYTLFVNDAETGEDLASIDRVVGVSSCPRYPDRYLAVVRLDDDGVGRLWTGPFDQLVRAELDLAIDRHLRGNWSYEPDPTQWRMTVLGARGPAPAGRGIYEIDLAQLTIGVLIPPVLADVTWAPGAVPSSTVPSDGLALADVAIVHGFGNLDAYLYRRHMTDGSEVMFTGPWSSDASRELALFPIAGETAMVFLARGTGVPIQGDVVTWQQTGASTSDADLLLNWDTANQHLVSCPFAHGTLPLLGSTPGTTRLMGIVSPDRTRYAFADADAFVTGEDPPSGPLVEHSIAGAGSCALLATRDVRDVVLADEAVAWIESPGLGDNQTLWVAGAPGDTPRAVGRMKILEAPRFIAPNTLHVQLGTDLVWLDVRDDPVKLHYVAEGVFGRGRGHVPTTGPRWLVLGYELSSQDDTGTLGVVDWHNGDKHPISPAVVDFIVSSQRSSDLPLNIVYQVRGRSASSQDGIWVATINVGDLPE